MSYPTATTTPGHLDHRDRWSIPAPSAEERVSDGIQAVLAFLMLVVLAPLMLLIAVAVAVEGGRPLVFAHRRVGRDSRFFPCFKFRTMVIDADERLAALLASDPEAQREWDANHKLRKDPRVTRLGAFLRKSSLDELPQLFNVLRGEMSLVGPRPIVQAEIAKYGRRFRYYCAVKPGITGLWQVSGRNEACYRRRVALDCLYARRRTLGMDIRILLGTIPAVLRGSC